MGKGGPDPKQEKVPLRGERWVAVRQNLLLRSCCDTGVSGPGPWEAKLTPPNDVTPILKSCFPLSKHQTTEPFFHSKWSSEWAAGLLWHFTCFSDSQTTLWTCWEGSVDWLELPSLGKRWSTEGNIRGLLPKAAPWRLPGWWHKVALLEESSASASPFLHGLRVKEKPKSPVERSGFRQLAWEAGAGTAPSDGGWKEIALFGGEGQSGGWAGSVPLSLLLKDSTDWCEL